MINLKKIVLSVLILSSWGAMAQDDLLNELDTKKTEKNTTTSAFKALQIVNMQSTKLPAKGEIYILISHRFGDLSNGINNFFGLDNAFTKIGGIYGVTDGFSVGLSRHTLNKTYEIAAKYKLANQQDNGFPVSIVAYHTLDINSALSTDLYPGLKATNRLAYTTQLLVSKKFTNEFSLQLAPIFVHKNLYDGITDQKNQFLLATGARYKLTKRLSLNAEYAARLNLPEGYTSIYHNPLSIGLDIETGGHVFQMVLSNSQAMNDVSFLTNATGITAGKGIFFGFNMYRVF
ncbi:DUF5777 family beta-barrel protein [Flavobacterium branchiophilum]|uniref:DUF5777 domain-containing protein n=1 Tax=Flavobacterium branchiophilum TaxID=55197 RepID=A0A2H3KLJ6_9FLAO|nr:DUF5777 family beta-barrel protein [Flavobacterium branchiophilum]PDS24032.1 hypothetical protein B0A77_09430 [Flavobacterium branchiophilum]